MNEDQQGWRLTYAGRMEAPSAAAALDVRRIIGRLTLHAASHLGRISYLVWEIARGLMELKIWIPRAFEQGMHVGYGSLFIVLLTAAFAGGVTALQAGYQFTGNIPVYIAAGVITQTIILELGPVLTALILAGRIGARYAAELGTMRVTEQIDALESLGRSSVSHLIIPRVVAGTLMVPVLVVFANLIGIWAGWLGARAVLDITNADFAFGARYFFRPWDLWYSMIKSLFFGLAITVIPCYMGFSTKQGAEGVGRATTAAVVSASVMILFLDALLARVLLPTD
jgi:phospholipid/cholesterol/gamma-HCH transport system permease protein